MSVTSFSSRPRAAVAYYGERARTRIRSLSHRLFSRGSASRFLPVSGVLLAAVISAPGAARADINLRYFDITEGRLAFSYTEKGETDLYVIDFSTLNITPIAQAKGVDEWPSWSPDGSRLVFYSDRSGDREIWTVKSDGTGLTQLTKSPGADEDPDWSPDGSKIIFQSVRGSKGSNLMIMNPDGSKQEAWTTGDKVKSTPRWSPRNDEILYSTNEYWPGWDIVVLDIATKKARALTNGYRSFCRPFWHPSGSSYLFSYGSGDGIDIWTQEKGETEPKVFISRPGKDYDAIWNQKGDKVFFTSEMEPGKGRFELFVFDPEENKQTQITESSGSIRYLSWTPYPSIEALARKQGKDGGTKPGSQTTSDASNAPSPAPAAAATGAPAPSPEASPLGSATAGAPLPPDRVPTPAALPSPTASSTGTAAPSAATPGPVAP